MPDPAPALAVPVWFVTLKLVLVLNVVMPDRSVVSVILVTLVIFVPAEHVKFRVTIVTWIATAIG